MYINNKISYQRRTDLEKGDCGVIIIDIKLQQNYRILGLYRTFNPNNQISEYDYFKSQIDIITDSCADHSITSIVMGDFNLNENQKNNSQYSHHRYYDLLQSKFNDINLIQIVKFNTWSRLVENTWKESCLDHIYTNDTTSMININSNTPLMGDHKIITATLGDTKPTPKITEK